MADRRRLAVLGRPIGHSQSPALHSAAYAALGLDWSYNRVEVGSGELDEFLGSLDDSWRGLSLTMPLKREVLPRLAWRHPLVEAVGAANTVLFRESGSAGFNTDVVGIVAALGDAGVVSCDRVLILGGGATAASAVAAVSQLGARRIEVAVRTPARAVGLAETAERAGSPVRVVELGEAPLDGDHDLVISTLPGGTALPAVPTERLRAGSVLFDVAYDPWPSELALSWSAAGGGIVPGIDMLLHQAVAQVRVFLSGSPDDALPDEPRVVAAMRGAVGR